MEIRPRHSTDDGDSGDTRTLPLLPLQRELLLRAPDDSDRSENIAIAFYEVVGRIDLDAFCQSW